MYECLLTDEESHYAAGYNGFIRVDLSFDAKMKPEGIPHFNSSSPTHLLNFDELRQKVKEWIKL
jgi:hypothetical protein